MSEVDNSPASRVSSSIFLLAPRVLLVKTRLALRVTQGLIATAVADEPNLDRRSLHCYDELLGVCSHTVIVTVGGRILVSGCGLYPYRVSCGRDSILSVRGCCKNKYRHRTFAAGARRGLLLRSLQ